MINKTVSILITIFMLSSFLVYAQEASNQGIGAGIGGGDIEGEKETNTYNNEQSIIQSITPLPVKKESQEQFLDKLIKNIRRYLRMPEIGSQSVYYCGTISWCVNKANSVGGCKIVSNCKNGLSYLFCGSDNSDSKINKVCNFAKDTNKPVDKSEKFGDCTESGYNSCYDGTYSYGPATAHARIAFKTSKEVAADAIRKPNGGVYYYPFKVYYKCNGDKFSYGFRANDEDWLSCSKGGCSGSSAATNGILSFTKDDIISKPINTQDKLTRIYLECWDRKDRNGYWSWVWVGYWYPINPDDIGSCATESDCSSGQYCDYNKMDCVVAECTTNSECGGKGICQDYKCSCSTDSDCGDSAICGVDNQCVDVECKQDTQCPGGVCSDNSCVECKDWNDCSETGLCKNNVCTTCTSDTDCLFSPPQRCNVGACETVGCKVDSDCAGLEICDNYECKTFEEQTTNIGLSNNFKLEPGETHIDTFDIDISRMKINEDGSFNLEIDTSGDQKKETKKYSFIFKKEGGIN